MSSNGGILMFKCLASNYSMSQTLPSLNEKEKMVQHGNQNGSMGHLEITKQKDVQQNHQRRHPSRRSDTSLFSLDCKRGKKVKIRICQPNSKS